MALSKEIIKRELDASKAALKAHKEGIEVHLIDVKAFQEELEKCKQKK